MRILFAGTPEVAIPTLEYLYNSRHDVIGVLTRRDAEIGRKRVLTPAPVAARAEALGIPVIKSDRIDTPTRELISDLKPDLAVVVAYGALVGPQSLAVPRHGWINLHFSLLPAWRGAAPVQYSILNGDTVGGASVFQLVPELDAGPVYGTIETPISEDTTSGALLDELSHSGAQLVSRVVDKIAAGTATAQEQTGEVTLAPKLVLTDALIDWDAPAREVIRRINAMTPEPGAFSWLGAQRFKIGSARLESVERSDAEPGQITFERTGSDGAGKKVLVTAREGVIELMAVQPAGKKMMDARDWARGHFAGNSPISRLRSTPEDSTA